MKFNTRKILKLANQGMYILSIAMLISGMMLSMSVQPVAAAAGAIWTTSGACGAPQNVNFYSTGDEVFINYSGFDPGTYAWSIYPPGSSTIPIASGSETVGASGAGCFSGYTIQPTDAGEFKYGLGGKNDNFKVCGPGMIYDGKKCVPAPVPGISIVKSASGGPFSTVGQVINYSLLVTNTGAVALTNVAVSDPSVTSLSCPATSLAIGANMTCTAVHIITQADVNAGSYTNTASATSDQVGPVSDSVTVTIAQNPAMSFAKSVTSSGPYSVGGLVTYSLVVTDTGNVPLTSVTVVDSTVSNLACSPVSGSSLNPAQSMNCTANHTLTQADMDAGFYTNTAVADSAETASITKQATVGLAQGPAIQFSKTVTSTGPYGTGDTITYALTLLNTGNVTLTGITITDPGVAIGSCTPALSGLSLLPQASVTCTASHVVTAADMDAGSYTNTATGDTAQTDPLSASATVPLAQAPSLGITKVAAPGTYALGDTINYTITATNTGNVTLHNVLVTDPTAVIGVCAPSGASLAPAASIVCSATHVVTQADMDLGHFTNTSSAVSNEAGPVSASATVNFAQAPNLSIVKSITSVAPAAGYIVGDTLTYSILVTNTGNVTLKNVTVQDLNAVLGTCTPSVPVASLAVNGTITCAASHVVAQADLDAGSFMNTAVADSDQTDPKQDSATVSFVNGPAISFEKKEISAGPYFEGDTITYQLELTNIGNVTLHNLTITDPLAVIGTCTPALPVASLAPLGTITCAATHLVTAADIAAGLTFVNTATGGSDETTPKTSSITVNLGIKGCTDPKATNYNPKATVNDGSCKYPSNPSPTPVPTLPIPATGGTVLIPVTGADLSGTLPAGGLPRGLFLSGMSVFGFAMVLSGLRRKMHM